MGWNIVRAAVLLTWLTLGLVYLVRAPVMGTRPRRGTALTLSVRGYRILARFPRAGGDAGSRDRGRVISVALRILGLVAWLGYCAAWCMGPRRPP